MIYKRYDMETDEELIYRICSEKDKIGSWQLVADVLNETTIDMTGLCQFKYKKKEGLKKGHVQKVMKNWDMLETEMKVGEEDDPDYRILKCEMNQTLYDKVKETSQGKVK